ncbi:MAG: 50S ribosomal protein L9 [Candidatus Magasanikbacteria bacterium]
MKVLLLQNIPGLGKIDDVKDVAEGYARNFLFPRHLAVQSTAHALAEIEAQKKKKSKDELKDLQNQQALAQKLDDLEVIFKEKVSESGQLYAAIGVAKILEALKKMGYGVNKDQIILGKPIKEAGEYQAKVKLRHGLEATLNLVVNF